MDREFGSSAVRFLPAPDFGALMMARAKCSLSDQVCSNLLKVHVAGLKDEKYLSSDLEVIVRNYQELLVSLAAVTPRLNGSVMKRAARELFPDSPSTVNMFCDRIVDAFKYCAGKASMCTNGSKLSSPVQAVVKAFSHGKHKSLKAPPAPGRSQEEDLKGTCVLPCVPPTSSSSSSNEHVGGIVQPAIKVREPEPSSIYHLYGVSSPPNKKAKVLPEPAILLSSQEILSSQEAMQSGHGIMEVEHELGDDSFELPKVEHQKEEQKDDVEAEHEKEEQKENVEAEHEKEKQKQAEEEKGVEEKACSEWIDPAGWHLCRSYTDGRVEKIKLVEGPSGFAVAMLTSGQPYSTEVPNLSLLPPKVMKKPAKAAKKDEEEEQEDKEKDEEKGEEKDEEKDEEEEQEDGDEQDEEEEDRGEGKKDQEVQQEQDHAEQEEHMEHKDAEQRRSYLKMWYKNGNAWGIRRTFFDKKQIFQVGGKSSRLTKEQLRSITDKAIVMMQEEGSSETDAKAWAMAAVAAMAHGQ